uniref:Uncharacterized protein n=1 Tax=Oryza sativa subsp. japonica TaxID=39947 RepID=Q6Z7I2_ORYSJ|nr:hypothetical protein [Oryza sativa Japonica Group]
MEVFVEKENGFDALSNTETYVQMLAHVSGINLSGINSGLNQYVSDADLLAEFVDFVCP